VSDPPEPGKVAAPSPELASLIQRRIDEMPTEGLQYWVQRMCKESNALLLHVRGSLDAWALRPDGVVLCFDLDRVFARGEHETHPPNIYAALVQGIAVFPELAPLIPPVPQGFLRCPSCEGSGWRFAWERCSRCEGRGFRPARAGEPP
jgi:hypothetical protein